MSLQMLYIIPMLLGRTFDARTDSVGIDIFPREAVDNPRIKEEISYTSYYKKIESSADAKSLLGIKGALSLKIKGKSFGLKGAGSFLQETMNKENSIDVLMRVTYKTRSITIPPTVKPLSNWLTEDSKYLGTHFVQSIVYGGNLYACLRFKALKSEYMQEIKGAVSASLEAGSALDMVAEGRLEKVEKQLSGKASMEVSYFATVPLEGVPSTVDGLKSLVSSFDEQVKKVNKGWGVPVEVELADLSMYNSKLQYMKNSALESELGIFEDYLDDLLATKSRLKSWISNLPQDLPIEKERKIDDFRFRISDTLKTFYGIIAKLDMSKGVEQVMEGKDAYKRNSKSLLPGKFKREFEKLLKQIGTESEEPPLKGYSTYIHFGREDCPAVNGTSTVFSGYLASSSVASTGSGVNYVCLPKDPIHLKSSAFDPSQKGSIIQGVKFGLLEDDNPFSTDAEIILKGVLCSVCLAKGRPSISTIYDAESCPDGWNEEYSGFLMSTDSVRRSQYVCVNGSPESNTENYMDRNDQNLVFVNDPSKTEKSVQKTMTCIVCSK